MKLPLGNQKMLGPTKNAYGFDAFTNKVLVSLLRLLYNINSTVVYDEVFELLRQRGVFENKDEVINEPY